VCTYTCVHVLHNGERERGGHSFKRTTAKDKTDPIFIGGLVTGTYSLVWSIEIVAEQKHCQQYDSQHHLHTMLQDSDENKHDTYILSQ